ncbi:MAG: hypothetical protein D6707_10820, partial [Bacteroidetes bacterium]
VITTNDTILTAYLHTGKRYVFDIIQIHTDDTASAVFQEIRTRYLKNKTVTKNNVGKITDDVLSFFENHGYPYATLYFDSVKENGNKISALLKINKGELVTIDSVIIYGQVKISKAYLYNKLGIFPGDLYNESQISEISKNIDDVNFLQEAKKHLIKYKKDKVVIELFLKERKASKFSGIAGFMPDVNTGKTLITGDVNLNIINALGRGERFYFQWRRITENSQNLVVNATYPYLLNSKLGLNSGLSIYKRDTLFNNTNLKLGLDYLFSNKFIVTGFYEMEQSAVLSSISEETLDNLERLPYVTSYYGFDIQWIKTDYLYNPLKGFAGRLTTSAGQKKFTDHPQIPRGFTDSLNQQNLQFKTHIDWNLYVPTGKQSTIKFRINSGTVYGSKLVLNEIFRIGGLNTLRGFNEESLFASTFAIGTLEWRYIFEKNAAAYLFFDGAYYEKNINSGYFKDFPYGFGAGVNFETKAGIFNLAYALGSEQNNPIEIRNAKIHFGFVNFF